MLEQEGAHVFPCAEAVHGMGHSLAHGIGVSKDVAGWVVALADMPRVQPATIRSIADAIRDGATLAAPVYRGERGHPVGFAQVLRGELLALSGDSGARAVLERYRDAVRLVECDDPGIIVDIDAKTDLDRIT